MRSSCGACSARCERPRPRRCGAGCLLVQTRVLRPPLQTALFDDYAIESRQANNEILLKFAQANLLRALRCAATGL